MCILGPGYLEEEKVLSTAKAFPHPCETLFSKNIEYDTYKHNIYLHSKYIHTYIYLHIHKFQSIIGNTNSYYKPCHIYHCWTFVNYILFFFQSKYSALQLAS